MTDTPVIPRERPPVPRSEMVKAFIGDLARPFAIYVLAYAAMRAIIIVARKVENGNDGAIFLGAVGVLVTGIYLGKAWENVKTSKHAADVETAKATTT